MSFSRKAAFGYVPLMSRLVLAAAFIPAGWDKIMGEPIVYTGADAALLRQLGLDEAAGPGAALSQTPVYQDGSPKGPLGDRIRPRRPSPATPPRPAPSEEPQAGDDEAEGEDEMVVGQPVDPEPEAEAEAEVAPEPEPEPQVQPQPPAPDPAPAAHKQPSAPNEPPPVKARRLYRVAVTLVKDCPWPATLHPDWMAWVAAGTELIGGALILVGLFSRIWGTGLAITMAFAFYLTTLTDVVDMGALNLSPEVFNRAFTQLGLFVMALGVAMTGPGRISVDRFFFRSGSDDEEHLLQLG